MLLSLCNAITEKDLTIVNGGLDGNHVEITGVLKIISGVRARGI